MIQQMHNENGNNAFAGQFQCRPTDISILICALDNADVERACSVVRLTFQTPKIQNFYVFLCTPNMGVVATSLMLSKYSRDVVNCPQAHLSVYLLGSICTHFDVFRKPFAIGANKRHLFYRNEFWVNTTPNFFFLGIVLNYS